MESAERATPTGGLLSENALAGDVDRNDRAVIGLATVGHASVHTFELAIPLFIPLWLAEFDALDLFVASVPFDAAAAGVLVTIGYGLFGLGALPGGVLADRVGQRRSGEHVPLVGEAGAVDGPGEQ
jgi:MFS family permease